VTRALDTDSDEPNFDGFEWLVRGFIGLGNERFGRQADSCSSNNTGFDEVSSVLHNRGFVNDRVIASDRPVYKCVQLSLSR